MLLLPVGVGAQGVEDAFDPLAAQGPTFFSDAGYLGNPVTLPVGNYTQAALGVLGIANNSISSIRVQPGYKVEAFDGGDLSGIRIIVSGDTPSLAARAFDNKVSSMRISKFTVGATFYELCAKGGYNASLPVGTYTDTALATWGVATSGGKAISGVVPASGKEVEIFQGVPQSNGTIVAFAGNSRLLNKATTCLSAQVGLPLSGLDNLTTSLRIRPSTVLFKDTFNDSSSLAQWLPETGSWSIQNGKLVGVGGGAGDDAWIYGSDGDSFRGSIVMEANVDFVTGEAELVFNSKQRWFHEYRAAFWSNSSPAYPNHFQLIKQVNGQFVSLTNGPDDGNAPSPISIPDANTHIMVRRVGNVFDLYVNTWRIAHVVDSAPLPAEARAGLGVVWDFTAKFDNVMVRK